ncbi:MAG: DUF1080 domain-containing protein [Abitibacteriaceae bacterium]|nr:DUF1080 domain-containing protein [Abditibacteriaceae bacterium]MBV9864065.1 DUF1080 domain-containing protein [Abditibacteriaceae bacterium]
MKILGLIGAATAMLLTAQASYSQQAQTGGAGKRAEAEVFTDPAQAGNDFKLQGEYVGNEPAGKLGAQAVAKGDGKFDVYFLGGGLPGAGWDGKTRVQTTGAIDRTVNSAPLAVPLKGNGWSGMLRDGETLTGQTADGKEFTLKKVIRHSPNEGAKAPADATVLFDGTNTNQWQDGKIVEGNLLKWGAHSKKAFGDLKVHLEFRLPFKPKARGQERGNSGVKLQERYEIQVLDSFGLKGDQHECGAVYTQTAPLVNMCYPPLSWQTYDIDFKAARYDANGKKTANAVVSVIQNGVPVQNNTEIKNKTGASKAEGPEPLPLELQDHGNPVVFRNVWVVEPK